MKYTDQVNRLLDEIKDGFTGTESWVWTFPSEEAAMQIQAWLREQPGCEHADLRTDDHYRWPGKNEP